ncbi:MAG: metallophosphoesterase [Ignavibacteriales bacterium]
MGKKMFWWFNPITMGILILIVLYSCSTTNPVSGIVQNQEAKLTVLATADLHGDIPDNLAQYIQDIRKDNKNLILVDAGDYFDQQNSPAMQQWFKRYFRNPEPIQRRVPPIVREMGEMGYDAVVLGNHEFVANNRATLNEMVLDFTDYDIPVLSANLDEPFVYDNKTYFSNYVNPYIVKEIETEQGIVKVGILGLTIKEVGESGLGERELKDMPGYDGKLVLTDLVSKGAEMAGLMKANGSDVVIAVVHSGEEPLKPRLPGNKIKELARKSDSIDAIVAAHTHVNIPEHKFRNKSGGTVIVTQPGKLGEYCSKIDLVLTKEKGKWKVTDKSSSTVKM